MISPTTMSAAGRIFQVAVAPRRGGDRQPRFQRRERRLRAAFLHISERGVENEEQTDHGALDIFAERGSSTIAPSSIQGTGDQNFSIARPKACALVSAIALGPNV